MPNTTVPDRSPPRPPRLLPLAFRRDPLGTLEALAAMGDATAVRVATARVRLLAHPDAVREVLVTRQRDVEGLAFEAVRRIIGEGVLQAQGEAHRRQRRVLQPAFHRARLAAHGDVMAAHAVRWVESRRDGEILPLRATMVALTLAIVGGALFGDADAAAVDDVRAYLDAGLALYGPLTLPIARWMEHLPIPAARTFRAARGRLDARIAALVAARRAAADDQDDLLALLLAARDADDTGALGDRWVRDEVMTLVLAGHETTASALAWAFRRLADHPEAEAALHAEVDAVLGPPGAARAPGADDVARLPWTRAVFDETLRLHPTIPFVFRRARADVPLPPGDGHDDGHGDGAVLRRGEVAVLSPWVTQRDARWWPDPLAFRPARWLDEAARAVRPRFAWFPFGGGARVCLGEHFATMEGVLILAAVASRWRLRPLPDAAGRPERLDPAAPTRPPESWRVRVERRGA